MEWNEMNGMRWNGMDLMERGGFNGTRWNEVERGGMRWNE